jgi:quercetin dioxygenase-like cupin family protein
MPPRFKILLPTEQTANAVGIVEISVPPSWEGPPLHHHDFDESFYVLDGELTFQLGETLRTGGPGDLVFAPRGAFHTLANLGEVPPGISSSAPPANSPATSSTSTALATPHTPKRSSSVPRSESASPVQQATEVACCRLGWNALADAA